MWASGWAYLVGLPPACKALPTTLPAVLNLPRQATPPLTTVHWHTGPVGALCFSSDGVSLLSGGREGVLVIWQLENNRSNYLPRWVGGLFVGCCTTSGRTPAHRGQKGPHLGAMLRLVTLSANC